MLHQPPPPTLQFYKTGQPRAWTSRWRTNVGKRGSQRFGLEGRVSRREALTKYEKWLTEEWAVDQKKANRTPQQAAYKVGQLADDYEAHAASRYIKDGKPTSHVGRVGYAMAALRGGYGDLCAEDFDDLNLNDLLQRMIWPDGLDDSGKPVVRYDDKGRPTNLEADGKPRRLSLSTVNGRLHCVKQAYQHARRRNLVSRECVFSIMNVQRLKRGDTEAKPPRKVGPISLEIVNATVAKCPPTLAAMIKVQWLSAMRPGEVCSMRTRDIEIPLDGGVWLYRPPQHKTEHCGIERVVALGPEAQEHLKPFLKPDLSEYLFTPAQAQAERLEARHRARTTPLNEGNGPKGEEEKVRVFQPRYNKDTFRVAIARACKAAGVASWHPHQLRHSRATAISKQFGLQAASVVLGHNSISTTGIYVEKDLQQAKEIARQVG